MDNFKILEIYLKYLEEGYDYVKKHGHNRCKINSICWYFHNYEHGYKHCKGAPSNPYEIKHHNKIHIINKQYGRGHGLKKKTKWFKFVKKVKPGWWELETGTEIPLNKVPTKLK